jgi:hypothetical protein
MLMADWLRPIGDEGAEQVQVERRGHGAIRIMNRNHQIYSIV